MLVLCWKACQLVFCRLAVRQQLQHLHMLHVILPLLLQKTLCMFPSSFFSPNGLIYYLNIIQPNFIVIRRHKVVDIQAPGKLPRGETEVSFS